MRTSAVYLSPTSKRSGNQRELGHASWLEQLLALEVALVRRGHSGRFRWRVLFRESAIDAFTQTVRSRGVESFYL